MRFAAGDSEGLKVHVSLQITPIVDGKPHKGIVWLDTDTGEIEEIVLGEDGQQKVFANEDGDIIGETRVRKPGSIEIRYRDGHGPTSDCSLCRAFFAA